MGYRRKLARQVDEVLPPGETFRAAFPARGGFMVGLAHRYRVVVVSNCNVHLYSAALFSICKPKRLLGTLPEGAPFESRRELNYHILHLAGERLWVPFAHWKDLDVAKEAWRHTLTSAT